MRKITLAALLAVLALTALLALPVVAQDTEDTMKNSLLVLIEFDNNGNYLSNSSAFVIGKYNTRVYLAASGHGVFDGASVKVGLPQDFDNYLKTVEAAKGGKAVDGALAGLFPVEIEYQYYQKDKNLLASEDISILSFDAKTPGEADKYKPLVFADPDNMELKEGDSLLAYGFPMLGVDGKFFDTIQMVQWKLASLTFARFSEQTNGKKALELSGTLDHGMSGGPILNSKKHVVGLVSQGLKTDNFCPSCREIISRMEDKKLSEYCKIAGKSSAGNSAASNSADSNSASAASTADSNASAANTETAPVETAEPAPAPDPDPVPVAPEPEGTSDAVIYGVVIFLGLILAVIALKVLTSRKNDASDPY